MNQLEIMDLIETERLRKEMSLRKLGTASGLSHATYQSARKHGKSMEYETVRKLLEAVGFKIKVVKQ